MKRIITLGNGVRVTLGNYIAGVKLAKVNPSAEFKHTLCKDTPGTGAEICREFMAGVHDRINQHIPNYGRGRKWSSDWDRSARNFARDVNTPRLRVYVTQCPKEFRERLSHRLATRWDD